MGLTITPNPGNAFPVPEGDLDLDIPAWREFLLNSNAAFDPGKHDEPVIFSLQTPAAAPATFDATGGVKLTLGGNFSAKTVLDLTWKEGLSSAEIKRLQEEGWLPKPDATNGELHVACVVTAQAQLKAGAQAPLGAAAQAALGLTAGGEVELLRVKTYARTEPARKILLDFFSTFRSPLRVPAGGQPGKEIVSFAYNGSLKFTASLSAGYELAGFKGFTVGSLSPQLHYRLAAKASFDASFSASGAFRYTVGPGSKPDCVRLRLTKENAVGSQFGFGLVIGGELKTQGLPENTEKLLDALLGLDVGTAVGWLETVAGFESFDDAISALKEKFGDYAGAQLAKIAEPVFGKVFASEQYAIFRGVVQKITTAPAELRDGVVGLLDRFEGDRQKAVELLKKVRGLTPAALRDLSDNEVWEFVLDQFGDELLARLTSSEKFSELTDGAGKLIGLLETDVGALLTKLWTELMERTGLAKIAAALTTAADPTAARAVINEKLETLSEHAFGLAVEKLVPTAEGTAAFEKAKAIATRILKARDTLDAALKAAREQKFTATVGLEFGRTSENSALFELEFHIVQGRAELEAALAGDFEPALRAANHSSDHVRLLSGRLRQVNAATRTISVAAFGWSQAIVSKVEQVAEATVHREADGTVYLLTTDTAFDRSSVTKSKRQIEEVKTRLVLRSAATATEQDRRGRKFIGALLKSMTVTYAVAQSDSDTKWEELDDYLRFAEDLDLIPNPSPQRRAEFVAELQRQFANGPGKVGLSYAVQYPSDALLRALNTLNDDERDETARKAIRSYFAARYRTRQKDASARSLIEAYVQATHVTEAPSLSGPHHHGESIKADVHFADGTSKRIGAGAPNLLSWWNEETRFLAALDELATAVAGPVDSERLDRFTQAFVRVAEGKPIFGSELWTENVFFLAVDALLTHPRVRNTPRQALLTLQIQPPGAAQPTTRILPSANVAVA